LFDSTKNVAVLKWLITWCDLCYEILLQYLASKLQIFHIPCI